MKISRRETEREQAVNASTLLPAGGQVMTPLTPDERGSINSYFISLLGGSPRFVRIPDALRIAVQKINEIDERLKRIEELLEKKP